MCLILILVEKEVFLCGIIGPNVLDGFVDFAFFFELLEVFNYLHGGAAADGVVDEFVLCCGPGSIFEFCGKFKSPVHIFKILSSEILCVIVFERAKVRKSFEVAGIFGEKNAVKVRKSAKSS